MNARLTNTAGEQDVAAAIAGDRDAVQRLWNTHRRWVAAVLLTYKPREIDLEDLLQEVAMTLVSKINTLREEANVRAWLRVVAVNAARAAARTLNSRPKPTQVEGDLPDQRRDAIDRQEGSEHARRLLALTDELPDGYREPLILRTVHGMKSKEVGRILDLPPATIDTRVARARKMLRAMLDERDAPAHHSDEAVNQGSVNGHLTREQHHGRQDRLERTTDLARD